jgi:uncharacterized membrane protein (DUF2068 family)
MQECARIFIERPMPTTTHKALRVIAAFKLFKALGLIIVAVAAFDLVRSEQLDAFAEWIARLPILHGHHVMIRLLDAVVQLGPRKFVAIGIAACIYASLFLVEAWGLWHAKRWAEYLTVIATTSVIPFELWEIAHHVSWLKISALLVNVAIVWYLIRLLRRERQTQ